MREKECLTIKNETIMKAIFNTGKNVRNSRSISALGALRKLRGLGLVVCALLFCGLQAWGADKTFDWSSETTTAAAGTTDYVATDSPITLTFSIGTHANNAPRINKEGSVRMYTGNTLTIASSSGNITRVVFTPTSDTYAATNLSYDDEDLESDDWTLPSASSSVTLTAGAAARFKYITVYYGSSTFTATIARNNTSYGTVSHSSVGSLSSGATITKGTGANINQITIGGTTVTATPAAQDADYDYAFSSWTVPGNVTTVTADITITANFTRTARALTNYRTICAASYDIVLDDGLAATINNGSAEVTNNDNKLTNISAPTKNGYDVEGYYTTSALTTKIATAAGALQNGTGTGITVGGNAWTNSSSQWVRGAGETFYTKWTAHAYDITYEGLEGASNTNPTSYTIETATIVLADPGTRNGYTFAGWTLGGSPITQIALGSTGDKTITATWTTNKYNVAVAEVDGVTITATPSGGDAIAEGSNANVDYDKSVALAHSGLETGIYWVGWKVTNAGGDDVTASVVSENTLTVPAYNVTVTAVLGKMKAWCMPEFEVTGDVHLTSAKDVYVNLTADAGNLLTFSGTNMENVTKITIDYLDNNGDVVASKASSPLRLYNSGGSSLAEGPITSGFSTGTYSDNFSVRFLPTAYGELDNYTLRLKIYKDTRVLKTVEHPMNGRALPEEFVIAVKNGDNWYALPNTLAATQKLQGTITPIKITVDDANNPTKASYASSLTVYKGTGRNAPASNINGIRFTNDGSHWLQTSTSVNKMWLSGTNSDNDQVWYLKSSNFRAYELSMDPSHSPTKKMGIYDGKSMGYHNSPSSYNIYLLPIESKFTARDAIVKEWGEHGLILEADMTDVASATMNIDDGSPVAANLTAVNAASLTAGKNVRIYNADLTIGAVANEGKQLYVHWKNAGGTDLAMSQIEIPRIIASSRNMKTDGEPYKSSWKDKEVHVLPGATLTANTSAYASSPGTASIGELHIYPGATLNVSTGTLTATTLRLHNGWTRAGAKQYNVARVYIASGAALTKTTASMDYDIYELSEGKHYYPLAVPFTTAITSLTDSIDYADPYLAGVSTYGTHYVIKEYDGANRASSGPDQTNNWDVVSSGSNLTPGKGYIMTAVAVKGEAIIRVPLTYDNGWTANGELATYDAVTKNVVPVSAYGGDAATAHQRHKGWNMLGVPFMSCYGAGTDMYSAGTLINGELVVNTDADENMQYQSTTIPYVSVPSHDFAEYVQTDITDTKLLPGWSFFVQVSNSGNLTFAVSNRRPDEDNPIYAPQRTKADEVVRTGIILSDGNKSDKTTLLISDMYSAAEYEINADLEKMFGDGYTLATYSLSGDTRLAYNAMNTTDAKGVIPIGFRAPEDGEYTFSLNPRYADAPFERVDLIDYLTGEVTNLMMSEYTFTTGRTQDDSRFALNVVPMAKVPTGVDGVNADSEHARKIILDDKMYIIYDGLMYDATGKRVVEINK